MSAHRQYSNKHAIPANPTWIEFERSDGDSSTWPTNTTPAVDHEGHVNFMRPVSLDEPICAKWRLEVGLALATALKLASGPSYVLKAWPEGYQMFDHNKGLQSNPRHDAYLMGSKSRFRSVPEFIPHAIWLKQDPTMDRSNCQCKYCTKTPQRAISFSMGLTQKRLGSASSSPAPSRFSKAPKRDVNQKTREARTKRLRESNTYIAVQRPPKPTRPTAPPKQPIAPERNNDIRAVSTPHQDRNRRWFRKGELLWCYLNPPIKGPRGDGDDILFWPGLVEEIGLGVKTTSRVGSMDPQPVPNDLTHVEPGMPNPNDKVKENGANTGDYETPWIIHQHTTYKMKLLVVSHTMKLTDHELLPYQSYGPSTALIQSIQEYPWNQMDLSPEALKAFNPCIPSSDPSNGELVQGQNSKRFTDAIAPFALAVQIAAGLAKYWGVTDEWDFKFSVPPAGSQASSTTRPQAAQNGIASSSSQFNTSASAGPSSAGGRIHTDISAANHISGEELQALGTRLLGPPPPPAQTVTQIRYQGLWWGAERIWVDDLVRLKVARRQLAPEGADNVYPPAGPSQSTVKSLTEYAQVIESNTGLDFGAGTRGVVMRLEGLFVVDVPQEDGRVTKECRASGMLFEVADEDWEDPPAPGGKQPTNGAQPTPSASSSSASAGALAEPKMPSSPNSQLSHPAISVPYPLPLAPGGFKFRPILRPGHEIVISLTLLSGRYYPRLLGHPLLQSKIDQALSNPLEEGGLHDGNQLWALEALCPGYYNSVDPSKPKQSRASMLRDADAEGRSLVQAAYDAAVESKMDSEALESRDVGQLGMDVDS